MSYEAALQEWGARQIEAERQRENKCLASYRGARPYDETPVRRETVSVVFDFTEGYDCCGGSDPDCYCSYAESPRAEVSISARDTAGQYRARSIPLADFDFVTVLRELDAIGEELSSQ